MTMPAVLWDHPQAYVHVTVMALEVVRSLAPQPGGTYIDMTAGGGGHSAAILDACREARVIAFDREMCPSGWSPYEPAAGRVVVGVNAADAKNELSERQRGDAFGEESHTLSVAQMPEHHHDVTIFNPVGSFQNGADDLVANGGSEVQAAFGSSPTGAAGEGEAFTNAQPSLVLLYCVKD